MGTITSAGSGNWGTGATWVGGSVPANGDAVVIADGHAIVFNVDQSGFAAGIAGLTLGAGSTLTASTSAGAYYLKMAGNITASGAGAELRAGTAETAYPTNCTFTIYMNGNYSIDGGASNYLTCKFYCYDPPVKYLLDTLAVNFSVATAIAEHPEGWDHNILRFLVKTKHALTHDQRDKIAAELVAREMGC